MGLDQVRDWQPPRYIIPIAGLLICVIVNFIALFGLPAPVYALTTNLVKQPVTKIDVSLGNVDNELKFVPNHLEFEAGKRYLLQLKNPSQLKHYFTSKDFADAIWTQKIEAGKAEIKGAIHDLELKPSGAADWVFIPLKPGTYSLRCTIPGHAEAGMVGDIVVQ
ncbi:plastocyanin/azurin family copper-binding protein [Calothrix sp. NIES-3974]|uniref:plastocyanin/azurin family copper-binding protein n=1 Tax=Calothrix sp. NIES-3974 TaxID=2005462 RepID=UPI000B619F26|nr:plastocyanin/azurin family copper-binding protein [Calothrix sp. NIES-3974]BAZ07011.1 hypothetical protein NIES3974_36730 [Calothrix sp. NIES-3974]